MAVTLREKYEQQCRYTVEYRDALTYLVLGGVDWEKPAIVVTSGGMPKRKIRVGIVEATDPFVIVHNMDALEVWVIKPYEASQWPWQTVDAFPKLKAFLLKHVDIGSENVTIHMPG